MTWDPDELMEPVGGFDGGGEMQSDIVIHECPPNGSGLMPCCGRTPFERPAERMTEDPKMVTCRAVAARLAANAAPGNTPISDEAAKERAVSIVNSLPLTQAMVVEVLAARHRLGERHWPFRNQPGLHAALNELARRDLVEYESGVVGGIKRAMLTELGRLGAMSSDYSPPAAPLLVSAESERPSCIRCGGRDDLMDRAMMPGSTYCRWCREAFAWCDDAAVVEGLRAELGKLEAAITKLRATHADALADRDAITRVIMRERDEAREALVELRPASTHWGASPSHGGPIEHKGRIEDCGAPDCVDDPDVLIPRLISILADRDEQIERYQLERLRHGHIVDDISAAAAVSGEHQDATEPGEVQR